MGLLPCYILFATQENFHQIDRDIKSEKPYVIGYAYNENNYRYLKWGHLNHFPQYAVIALGSSRVLQFRDFMFRAKFYNAGYTVTSINDFKPFLESLPSSKLPQTLIISLDQWMFNENWDELASFKRKDFWRKSYSSTPSFSTLKNVYSDILHGKYLFPTRQDSAHISWIGLNAVINKKGFRNDGSISYGSEILGPDFKPVFNPDKVFQDTFIRIERGVNRFEFGQTPNRNAYYRLNHLLKFCKEKQINVIAFLPPFPPAVYDRLQNSSNHFYMFSIFSNIKNLFQQFGYKVYDFSSANALGSHNEEFVDGFHGGEVVYARVLLEMSKSDSTITNIVDVSSLTTLIYANTKKLTIANVN